MKDYNKLISIKPQAGVKMEARLTGTATPEDAGKAIRISFPIVAVGLMVMLAGVGIGAALIGYGFLISSG